MMMVVVVMVMMMMMMMPPTSIIVSPLLDKEFTNNSPSLSPSMIHQDPAAALVAAARKAPEAVLRLVACGVPFDAPSTKVRPYRSQRHLCLAMIVAADTTAPPPPPPHHIAS